MEQLGLEERLGLEDAFADITELLKLYNITANRQAFRLLPKGDQEIICALWAAWKRGKGDAGPRGWGVHVARRCSNRGAILESDTHEMKTSEAYADKNE
jgi:hypothetical protein